MGDLRKTKEELEALSSKYQENLVNIEAEVAKLMEEKDKLKSDNSELAAENIQLKTDQDEKEQTWRREMSQLSLDNQLLQKNLNTTEENHEEDRKTKNDLLSDKEKTKN